MHVLEAQQFSREWLEKELFPLAERLARADLAGERPLRDRRLFWLFYEPSTRTRVSFESAMALLGGSASQRPNVVGPINLHFQPDTQADNPNKVTDSGLAQPL